MKKNYQTLALEIIVLQAQDVVTLSGFNGEDHVFGNPNSTTKNGFTSSFFEE